MLQAGCLEVIQVLLQRRLVELRKKLRLNRDVETADIIDDLTFGHGYNTFAKATVSRRLPNQATC